jgi:hypothetical protein
VADYPDERTLGEDSVENVRRIRAVTSPEAIVAAGGLCAPVEVRYALEETSSNARPVREALAQFGATRGGVRYIEPPVLDDVDGAVSEGLSPMTRPQPPIQVYGRLPPDQLRRRGRGSRLGDLSLHRSRQLPRQNTSRIRPRRLSRRRSATTRASPKTAS